MRGRGSRPRRSRLFYSNQSRTKNKKPEFDPTAADSSAALRVPGATKRIWGGCGSGQGQPGPISVRFSSSVVGFVEGWIDYGSWRRSHYVSTNERFQQTRIGDQVDKQQKHERYDEPPSQRLGSLHLPPPVRPVRRGRVAAGRDGNGGALCRLNSQEVGSQSQCWVTSALRTEALHHFDRRFGTHKVASLSACGAKTSFEHTINPLLADHAPLTDKLAHRSSLSFSVRG